MGDKKLSRAANTLTDLPCFASNRKKPDVGKVEKVFAESNISSTSLQSLKKIIQNYNSNCVFHSVYHATISFP